MKKVLFWDFDGTLVHANESFILSLEAALNAAGYAIPQEKIRAALKETNPWYHWERIYPERVDDLWWVDLHDRLLPHFRQWGIGDTHALYADFRQRVIAFPYALYGDAVQTLQTCREMGYIQYILSNNFPELPQVVQRLGLAPFFADMFVSGRIGYEKPRMELYRHALAAAGHPGMACMIGDNPVADMEGGKAAGLTTFYVHKTGAPAADHECAALSEIPSLLS